MASDALLHTEEDGRLAMVGSGHVITDTGTNGEPVLFAYQTTGESRYRIAAERLLDYFLRKAPKTPDGILYHFYRSFHEGFSPCQIWADACFMAPPFLAAMGHVDMALRQLEGFFRYLQDPKTGLLFHIYDVQGECFVRKALWATGNGWALLGLTRATAGAQKSAPEVAARLRDMARMLVQAMIPFQEDVGLFHDILDQPASFLDGTSAMMMAGTVYRGVYEGWLDKRYLANADRVYEAMCRRVDGIGILHEVCGSPDFMHAGNSAEAQASFLLMDAWRENLLKRREGGNGNDRGFYPERAGIGREKAGCSTNCTDGSGNQ